MYTYDRIGNSGSGASGDRSSAAMDQPLFGETRRRDKIINIVLAAVTAVFIAITLVLALLSSLLIKDKCKRIGHVGNSKKYCVYPLDIVFCGIIILLLVPQIIVAYWYRRGELEPKFRSLIYYNAVVTVLLCIVGILYFMQVGYQ
jgi:preprotein translocase subunit SecG